MNSTLEPHYGKGKCTCVSPISDCRIYRRKRWWLGRAPKMGVKQVLHGVIVAGGRWLLEPSYYLVSIYVFGIRSFNGLAVDTKWKLWCQTLMLVIWLALEPFYLLEVQLHNWWLRWICVDLAICQLDSFWKLHRWIVHEQALLVHLSITWVKEFC